jgi:hypothetical protein
MVTRADIKSRRRAVRAVEKVHHGAGRSSLGVTLTRLALSRPARAAYVTIGAVGLAALAVALVGPKRIERDVIKPLREQIAGLFESAPVSGRAKLVKSLQSWIGHFHAT